MADKVLATDPTNVLAQPRAQTITGREMIYAVDPVTRADMKFSANDIAALAASPDMGATNSLIGQTNTLLAAPLVIGSVQGLVTVTGTVAIAGTVPVSIAGNPTFNIGTMPPVSLSGTPTFNVGTMPQITFASAQPVTINGTPTVNANINGVVPVSVAAPVAAQTLGAKAAAAGTLFSACTGPVTLTGTAAPMAALVNPAGSGKNLVVTWTAVGCGVSATYTRSRNPTGTAAGTLITPVNEGGGTAASVAKFYQSPTGLTAPATGGKVGFTSSNGADARATNGELILKPGESLLWTAYALVSLLGLLAGAATFGVEIVYSEVPV